MPLPPLARPAILLHPAVVVHPAIPAPAHPGGVLVAPPPRIVPSLVVRPVGTTVNPAIVHLLNPGLLPPRLPGQPRTAFSPPWLIAPGNPATDAMLFEAPANPAQRFFLPHYALAVAPGPGPRAQWVSLASAGDGCHLTINLTDVTPTSLSSGNERISAGVSYLLMTSLQGRATNWTLTPVPPPAGSDLTLTLDLPDFASRNMLYAAMTDPAAQTRVIIRHDLAVALPAFRPPNAYLRANVAVDTTVPFTFNKDLDGNVFAGLHGASSQLPGWNVTAVNWNGIRHTYYQANNQPAQVYYLPDGFVVGRQADPPHRPALTASASGTDAANVQMTLSYTASPIWNPDRIAAAANQLKTTLGLNEAPTMGLFQATDTALFLNLPNADGSAGSTVTEQKGVLIDLSAGVQGSVTLDAAHFRPVFNAFFNPGAVLMSGEVRVTVSGDVAKIPFTVRIADYPGDLVTSDTSVDIDGNMVEVVLTNAIDCVVHIDSVTGVILRSGAPIASSVSGLSDDLPFDLAPAGANAPDDAPGTLTVSLAPPQAAAPDQALTQTVGSLLGNLLTGGHLPSAGNIANQLGHQVVQVRVDNTCTAQLDLSKLTAVPDPKSTWRAILDDRGGSAVSYSVTVELAAAPFVTPLPKPTPPDALLAVQVVFDGGQTVTFNSALAADGSGPATQTIKLSAPIEAFMLSNAPLNTYNYRVDTITGAGVKQGTWATDNKDTLIVVVS